MNILLENISKKFSKEWIFKNVNYQLESDKSYAIVGYNGSGKSTLLKIIANGLLPSLGNIKYSMPHKRTISEDEINSEIAFTAPYISLIEEFTLNEIYHFHTSLKKLNTENIETFLEILDLKKHQDKLLKNFSSGMKQRVKLAIAFLSETQTILLDEPTSNLDNKGIDWYHQLIEKYTKNRIVVIGSNQKYEYTFCNNIINIVDYK